MTLPPKPTHSRSEAARMAAQAARAAKRDEPDTFGDPELFIVKAGDQTFTWELRRFGGVLLERGAEAFGSQAEARIDGELKMAALRASPDLPSFKRQAKP